MRWHGRLRAVAVMASTAFAIAAPAVAQAADWQRVADPAPGGTTEYSQGSPRVDLAVAGSTPYLAAVTPEGQLGIWRPAGTAWQQVGGALNHAPVTGLPSLTAAGTTPWVAWTETDAAGLAQVHVARLDGSSFQEVVGGARPVNRPGTSATGARIAIYEGRPYVAYNETAAGGIARLVVARLSSSGTAFEQVSKGLPAAGIRPSLAVSGGRLYVSSGYQVLRLNKGGRTWQKVATSKDSVYDIADVSGTLYLVSGNVQRLTPKGRLVSLDQPFFATTIAGYMGVPYVAGFESPAPDVVGPPMVAAFRGGVWQEVPSPATANEGTGRVKLVSAADGSLWMLWDSSQDNSVFPPHDVHVARYG